MKLRPILFALAAASVAVLFAGCTTTYITPLYTAQPELIIDSPDKTIPATSKTFLLKRNWEYGPWVVKKGAQIVFYADGLGTFSGTVYSQYNLATEILHFQSIQYSADGNRLFSFPGTDVGARMHIRNPWTDYKYDINFGYDRRYFDDIDHVKWLARLRLRETGFGDPEAMTTNFKAGTTVDYNAVQNIDHIQSDAENR